MYFKELYDCFDSVVFVRRNNYKRYPNVQKSIAVYEK